MQKSAILKIFPVTLFLLAFQFAQGQVYAPLANVRTYGYSYDMEPGFYKKPVYLRFSAPKDGRFKYTISGGEGVYQFDNKPNAIIDSISTIALQIKVNGEWLDTIFVGTYFIRESITLPIVSLHLNRADFDAPGGILDGRLITSGDSVGNKIIKTEGRVWRKESTKTFVEFMDSTGTRRLGNMRIKPFGGMTIGSPEKGMRLVTDTTLGSRNIGFNPFPNKPFKSYRTLVLRASGNDQNQTRMKDMTLCSIAKDLGLDFMDYRPSVILVNGDYWGIYNIREKINYEYLYYNHKAPKNESTILVTADGGENEQYQEMVRYIGKSFPDSAAIDSVNSVMDLENYINFSILQIHIRNLDSRGNIRFWKSTALDNRWRWIFYDSDLSSEIGSTNDNFLRARLSPKQTDWYNPGYATIVLRNLTSHKPIRDLFINQYCMLLGSRLHVDTIVNRIDQFASILRPEIPHHAKRRGRSRSGSVKSWEEQISKFKRFFPLRDEAVYGHIMSTFDLNEDPVLVTITNNSDHIKSIRLAHTTWLFNKVSARFFPEVPLQIEATDLDYEYTFDYWKNDSSKSALITIMPSDSLLVEAVYKKRNDSAMRGSLFCDAWAVRESRKDRFFLFRLFNNSTDSITTMGMKLVKNGYESFTPLPTTTLLSERACWFTNDPERAIKIVQNEPIILLDSLTGFQLRGGTWMILDKDQYIVDKIKIHCPDSIYEVREIILATRNSHVEDWIYHGKIAPLEPHVPVFIAPIVQKASGSTWHMPASLLLIASCFMLLKKRRGRIYSITSLLLISFNQLSNAQPYCVPDKFGLDSIQTKLVDNKGKGFESLSGCRNIRMVLKNLLYRGGNNHVESVMNPLMPETIGKLEEQGFDRIYYLYSRNFVEKYPQERLDSIRSTGVEYSCMSKLDSISLDGFLRDLHARASSENHGMVYAHCWNGWHQSGWLSAITLMQFCGYTNSQALRYWELNTDGVHKGYNHVKKGILEYVPIPDLDFNMMQRKKYCPCASDSLLNSPHVSMKGFTGDSGKYHVVKKGETLLSIARKYHTSVAALKRINQIANEKKLIAGTRLRVR
jgi:hypothetical protein